MSQLMGGEYHKILLQMQAAYHRTQGDSQDVLPLVNLIKQPVELVEESQTQNRRNIQTEPFPGFIERWYTDITERVHKGIQRKKYRNASLVFDIFRCDDSDGVILNVYPEEKTNPVLWYEEEQPVALAQFILQNPSGNIYTITCKQASISAMEVKFLPVVCELSSIEFPQTPDEKKTLERLEACMILLQTAT